MTTDLKQAIAAHQIILLTMSKATYLEKEFDIITAFSDEGRLCAVLLNKPYISTKQELERRGQPLDQYYFIDVLTSGVQMPSPAADCSFLDAPGALTDLSLAISDALGPKGCSLALFDALSTLTIHVDLATLTKFVQTMTTRIRVLGKKAVLISLREDSEEFMKDLAMFADAMVEMS